MTVQGIECLQPSKPEGKLSLNPAFHLLTDREQERTPFTRIADATGEIATPVSAIAHTTMMRPQATIPYTIPCKAIYQHENCAYEA